MSIVRPLTFQSPLAGIRRAAIEVASDDARLTRLGLRLGLAAVGLLVLFAGFYAYDRYFVPVDSPLSNTARTLEDQVRQSPNDLNLRMQIASVYAQQQRYDQAVAQYEEILNVKSDSTPALFGLASVEQARGNDARAEQVYRQIADMFKDSEFRYAAKELQIVYYRLGVYASKASRFDEAVSWAKDSLQVEGSDSDTLYLLGTSEEAQGNLDAARDVLSKAVAYDPSFHDGWTALQRVSSAQGDQAWASDAGAMAQFTSGDVDGALASFKQLVAVSPDFAPAYEGLGLVYAKQNDRDNAVSAFRSALDRDPDLLLSQWSLSSLGGDK